MASKKTEVIYRRPKGSYDDHDPDMWEDDAIIKAYDEAVSDVAMPASSTLEDALTPSKKLRTENPEMGEPIWQRSSGLEGTGLTIESSGTGTELKDSDQTKRATENVEWKIGDSCVAKYSEDSLYYDAVIESIDLNTDTCNVEFVGYGNKETVNISDVHHASKWDGDENQTINKFVNLSLSSGTESDEDSSSVKESVHKHKKKSKQRHPSNNQHPNFQFSQNSMPFMPPPLMPFSAPLYSNFQSFPPYVPPMPNVNNIVTDSESPIEQANLSSLLMSWYMAGYQTGYFQGRYKKLN